MASIRKNQSGNWEVRIKRKGVPQMSRSFPTKRAADAFAASMEDKIARGKSIASPDSFTVGEALEEYAESIAVEIPPLDENGKPRALNEGEEVEKKVDPRVAAYLNGLLPHFGQFSIGFLRSKHIMTFVKKMRATPKPSPRNAKKRHPLYSGDKPTFYAESTIRKFIYTLKAALDYHARQHSYTYDFHLFSEEKPEAWSNVRKRRLKENEEKCLLEACRYVITRDSSGNEIRRSDRKHGNLYSDLVRLLLETGARYGELLNAEWQEFDIANRTWSIPKEHVKTREPREVPLSKIAVSILERMKDEKASKQRPFEKLPKGKSVFITWKRICKDAQVVDIGFHDFRHEAISRWVIRGGSDMQISKAAGHDISVMQQYVALRAKEMMDFVNA